MQFCALWVIIPALYANVLCAADTYDVTYRSSAGEDVEGYTRTTERNHHPSPMICSEIKPQHTVNIEQIRGMWYGNEIIVHTQDVPGVYLYESCVIVHLSDITNQMQNYNSYRRISSATPPHQYENQQQDRFEDPSATKYLRLVWTERDDNLEYTFNYTEFSPGLWTNVGDQRGSLVALNHYTQFAGTVHVVKAVNDHLVLTFCGKDITSSIYTLVLSRTEQGLSSEDLRSIRNLLSRRGLDTKTIRKVCTSAAVKLKTSTTTNALFLTVLGIMSILRKHY